MNCFVYDEKIYLETRSFEFIIFLEVNAFVLFVFIDWFDFRTSCCLDVKSYLR